MVLLKNTTHKKVELKIKLFSFQRTRKLAASCVLQYRQIGKSESRKQSFEVLFDKVTWLFNNFYVLSGNVPKPKYFEPDYLSPNTALKKS